jgi:hypothetical protein
MMRFIQLTVIELISPDELYLIGPHRIDSKLLTLHLTIGLSGLHLRLPIVISAPPLMSKKELITLLSLDDAAQAGQILSKLETEGIECFMKTRRTRFTEAAAPPGKPVDIRVYMKDLDRALQLIAEEPHEQKEPPPAGP